MTFAIRYTVYIYYTDPLILRIYLVSLANRLTRNRTFEITPNDCHKMKIIPDSLYGIVLFKFCAKIEGFLKFFKVETLVFETIAFLYSIRLCNQTLHCAILNRIFKRQFYKARNFLNIQLLMGACNKQVNFARLV